MWRARSILAALDGGAPSLNALGEAIRLAQWGNGRVTGLTVAPSYEGDLSLVGVRDLDSVLAGPCEEILEGALDVAEALGVRIKILCEEGEPHVKILERAESEGSDLIVMGASRRSPFWSVLLGSVMTSVIARSRTDVLVIPEGARVKWECALLALDPAGNGESVAERALEWAAAYGCALKVTLLSAYAFRPNGAKPGEAESLQWIVCEEAREAGVRCEILPQCAGAPKALGAVAEAVEADMIIMGSSGRTGIGRLLGGCAPERIVSGSKRPVLIARRGASRSSGP
jgi:nucleotide-binding universal stress UspA family protein